MCTRVCVSSRCSLWLLPDSGTMVPSSFLSAVVEAEAVVEAVVVAVEAAKHECGRHQSMTALGNHLRLFAFVGSLAHATLLAHAQLEA